MSSKSAKGRNTMDEEKSGKPRQIAPCRHWVFTLYDYSSRVPELLDTFKEEKVEYRFQEEKCPKTGNLHLQGYAKWPKKIRDPKGIVGFEDMHWEKCRNIMASRQYTQKEDTHVGQRWDNLRKGPKDPLDGKILYKWQQKVVDLVKKEPDDRSIFWFWEPEGCQGKTALVKHMALKYDALVLSGKANDIKCGVVDWVRKKKPTKLFIFHFTRTMEEYISYEAIEAIKDGIFFSGKYESGMCLYDSPHILIFANFEPKLTALSKDRWHVHKIPKTEKTSSVVDTLSSE